jgi:hypothetical protein
MIRVAKSRIMMWLGHVAPTWREEKCKLNLSENFKEERPLWKHKCIWEDNIKMDIQDAGCSDLGWHLEWVT